MRKPSLTIPSEVDLSWRVPAGDKQAGMAQVHLWAKAGNLDGLARWQQAGGSLNEPWDKALGGDGSTPLLFAVMDTRSDAMAWLLAQGVDVNARNGRQRNALHLVAHRFSSGAHPLQDLDTLLRAGVDPLATEAPSITSNLGADAGITPFQAELGRGIFVANGKSYRMEHLCRLVDTGLDLSPGTPLWNDAADVLGEDELQDLTERSERVRLARQRLHDLHQRPAPARRSRHRS